jgi:glycosyltransferase involved in cell wall biosynthesis
MINSSKQEKLLTVFVPTYNRDIRLRECLRSIGSIIIGLNLQESVCILISNNGSTDNTSEICRIEEEELSKLGITARTIHNDQNLGFSMNVFNGLSKFQSEYIFMMSDDDNLIEDSFAELLREIQVSWPDLLYCNFDQYPYGKDNPKIIQREHFIGAPDYLGVRTLIEWPKMTGIVIRKKSIEDLNTEIKEICRNCSYFPHVIIAMLLYLRGNKFLKSTSFIAKPDEDYLDHLDFVPYVGDYLVPELSYFLNIYDVNNPVLIDLIESRRSSRIVDTSLSWLTKESLGNIRISVSVKKILRRNIRDFLLGRKVNEEGFELETANPRLLLKTLKYIFSRSIRSICSK